MFTLAWPLYTLHNILGFVKQQPEWDNVTVGHPLMFILLLHGVTF